MTKMIIDNRATADKAYECYKIDRNEYRTNEELQQLVFDCMNEDVYCITVTENEKVIIKVLNTRF